MLETTRYYVYNDDLFRWADRLHRLEQDWFSPTLERLRSGELQELYLHPCSGQVFHLKRNGLRRFWRKPTPLSTYLS